MEGQSANGGEKAEIVNISGTPKIKGTRTSVYFIFEMYQHGRNAVEISAACSNLSVEQVQAAIDYIEQHKPEVIAEYEKIMEPIRRGNPPEIEARLAPSREKIRAYKLSKKQSAAGA